MDTRACRYNPRSGLKAQAPGPRGGPCGLANRASPEASSHPTGARAASVSRPRGEKAGTKLTLAPEQEELTSHVTPRTQRGHDQPPRGTDKEDNPPAPG